MMHYAPAYTQAALDALVQAGRSQRKRAIAVIEALRLHPHQSGDCVIDAIADRDCTVLLRAGVLLTYWVDDAVCEIRIIAIDWVD